MKISRRSTLALSAALAAPFVRRAHAAETIKIGVVSPLTGPAAESGGFQRNGIKLAMDAINAKGGVLGRPLEAIIEDDQTTNPGAVLAFSRLAGNARHHRLHRLDPFDAGATSMAPDVMKTAKPMMIGGTDPTLDPHGQSRGCSAAARTTATPPA